MLPLKYALIKLDGVLLKHLTKCYMPVPLRNRIRFTQVCSHYSVLEKLHPKCHFNLQK